MNSITPGGMFRGHKDPFLANYCARVPMARMGNEDELRGAIVYLASDASSYVTGNIIYGRRGLDYLVGKKIRNVIMGNNRTVARVQIAGRRVAPGFPVFVIAEAGVNHNGDRSEPRSW